MWLFTILLFSQLILFCFEFLNRHKDFEWNSTENRKRALSISLPKKITRLLKRKKFSFARSKIIGVTVFRFLSGLFTGMFIILHFNAIYSKIIFASIIAFIDFFFNVISKRFSVNKKTSYYLYEVLNIVCLPFSYIFLLIDSFFYPVEKTPPQTSGTTEQEGCLEKIQEQLVKALTVNEPDASVTSLNLKLTKSIVHFKHTIVREAMIPKVDLFSFSEQTPIKDAVNSAIKEGYSRIPIHKKSIDSITGIVLFKDLLRIYKDCREGVISSQILEQTVSTIAKPAFYTPEVKQVSLLLQELRQRQMHMAIVVNEYGSTEGIVTMEDLLEEIVGEILDEYDTHPNAPFKKVGNSWIVDGRMHIWEAEDTLNIIIQAEGPYDTLGGHVFHKIGSSPRKGMKIHHDKFDIEILECSERSIEKLKITPIPQLSE